MTRQAMPMRMAAVRVMRGKHGSCVTHRRFVQPAFGGTVAVLQRNEQPLEDPQRISDSTTTSGIHRLKCTQSEGLNVTSVQSASPTTTENDQQDDEGDGGRPPESAKE